MTARFSRNQQVRAVIDRAYSGEPRNDSSIVVNASPNFFAKPSRLDVLHKQWAWAIFLTKRLMEERENAQARVEADKIDHFERPHRMVQSELQCFVNIPRAGDALLE